MNYYIIYSDAQDSGHERFHTPEQAAEWLSERQQLVEEWDPDCYLVVKGEEMTIKVKRLKTVTLEES